MFNTHRLIYVFIQIYLSPCKLLCFIKREINEYKYNAIFSKLRKIINQFTFYPLLFTTIIMSPEMLMQPFEQSFNVVPINNVYYHHNNTMSNKTAEEDENSYMMNYPMMDGASSGDFRPTFYNPFEIKHRRRTSRAQLKVLEKSFLENPKPNATVRRILAQKLDMTPRGVQIWFQNRRAKAKLQRRKSGEDHQEDHLQQQQQQQSDSPVLFSQFFNNLKAWDNSARSIANVAAASCMFDSNPDNMLMDQQHSSTVKIDEWLKLPIHPLAPVIDGSDDFDFSSSPIMSSEEWRRKSCPALGTRIPQDSNDAWAGMNNYHVSIQMYNCLL